jgi:hypothetical protein
MNRYWQTDMKSEHRHELQTNELGQWAEKAAAYIDIHGNRLMMIICGVAIVLSGGIFWWRMSSSKATAAWTDLSMAIANGNPETLRSVWDDHKGTVPGFWAKVREGEALLDQGVRSSFRNLENATVDLKKAREAFQLVVKDRGTPGEIRERALYGLGRASESLSDGTNSDAVKAYETLLKEFPNTEYKADAESRIEILNSGRGQEFYAWFSKYTRPKIEDKRPFDTGENPLDDEARSKLKDALNSTFKDSGSTDRNLDDDKEDLTLPGETDDKPASPKGEKPAEPDPATEKETESKPEQ